MYYVLMNKNTQVAYCKDDKVLTVLKENLLPIGARKCGKQYSLLEWLKGRQIPQDRNGIYEIKKWLESEKVSFEDFTNKNYGASINDAYWFYVVKSSLSFKLLQNKKFAKKIPQFKDISLYKETPAITNPLQILAERKTPEKGMVNNKLPDNTTNGTTLKYWVFKNGKYYLVKQNHPSSNKIAEKIIISQVLCDIINNVRGNLNNKKANIEIANYYFEAGKTPMESCCFTECFTTESKGLSTYAMIENSHGRDLTIDEVRDIINPSSAYLKEYFDFIILFDYLTENQRTKQDIGFMISNDTNKILGPAPLYGFSQTFPYMEKDYERTYKKDELGKYVNVFGMNMEEQVNYIAKIDWMDNRELFQSMEELKEFLEYSIDKRQLTLLNLENICNVINHKLYHIENKKYEIAEAEGTLEELGFEPRDEYDDDEENEDDNY